MLTRQEAVKIGSGEGITKEIYLQRFEGDQPLILSVKNSYGGLSKRPIFVSANFDDASLRWGGGTINNIPPNPKIVAGFEKKIKLEDFINYKWLWGGGIQDLFHKSYVDIFLKLCPNDVQILPVTLINLSDKVEPFENHDFFIVNILHTLDFLDPETTKKQSTGWGMAYLALKEPVLWQNHLVACDSIYEYPMYHPKLAKELYKNKQFCFMTIQEQNAGLMGECVYDPPFKWLK